MLREGLHVIKIVAAALWMCPLMLYMCCRVNAQPWLQHGYNGPATARQAYRLVCPRAFPPNYDNPKEHEPFWLPQLGLHALHAQCHYWEGTIAAALYLPVDAQENLVFSVEHIPDVTREILGNAKSLKQVVQAMETWFTEYMQAPHMRCALDVSVYYEQVLDHSEWYSHPINAMANRGLAMVTTELVIAVNCDFIPGPQQFRELLLYNDHMYESIVSMLGNGTDALVLNALDTHVDSGDLREHHHIAHHALQYGSKANITRWVSENKIVQFQAFGHEDTNWTKWLDASKPYYAVYKTFDGVWPSEYEPFFIARRESHPWYDERYRGYYNNKMSVTWVVKMLGTRFLVYPEAYVLHYAHTRQGSTFESGGKHKELNTHLYWHGNPQHVRDGCGVPLPFVADPSPNCHSTDDTLKCMPYSS